MERLVGRVRVSGMLVVKSSETGAGSDETPLEQAAERIVEGMIMSGGSMFYSKVI